MPSTSLWNVKILATCVLVHKLSTNSQAFGFLVSLRPPKSCLLLIFKNIFICTQDNQTIVAYEIFSCGMWDLVPQPRIKPRPTALEAWSPSHWTTREVQTSPFLQPLHHSTWYQLISEHLCFFPLTLNWGHSCLSHPYTSLMLNTTFYSYKLLRNSLLSGWELHVDGDYTIHEKNLCKH